MPQGRPNGIWDESEGQKTKATDKYSWEDMVEERAEKIMLIWAAKEQAIKGIGHGQEGATIPKE